MLCASVVVFSFFIVRGLFCASVVIPSVLLTTVMQDALTDSLAHISWGTWASVY